MISKDIFRAYDIRGTYNKNFFIEDAYLVGKAFASYLIEHDEKEVLIASDRRLSSPVLKEALLAGLVESGLHIIDIGFCQPHCCILPLMSWVLKMASW
jgi:phosphomannomutase